MTDYSLIFLFPEADGWVYIESEKDKRPIEETLRYRGKWVIYGSKRYVENLAKSLKDEVGKTIDAMKYSVKSTKVTPNAPERKHALLVYCDERRRDEIRNILESKGVKEVIWKYDRESLAELLDDPFFCLKLELFNPGRVEYLGKLLQIEINPEVLKCVQEMREYINKLSQKMKSFSGFESFQHNL